MSVTDTPSELPLKLWNNILYLRPVEVRGKCTFSPLTGAGRLLPFDNSEPFTHSSSYSSGWTSAASHSFQWQKLLMTSHFIRQRSWLSWNTRGWNKWFRDHSPCGISFSLVGLKWTSVDLRREKTNFQTFTFIPREKNSCKTLDMFRCYFGCFQKVPSSKNACKGLDQTCSKGKQAFLNHQETFFFSNLCNAVRPPRTKGPPTIFIFFSAVKF